MIQIWIIDFISILIKLCTASLLFNVWFSLHVLQFQFVCTHSMTSCTSLQKCQITIAILISLLSLSLSPAVKKLKTNHYTYSCCCIVQYCVYYSFNLSQQKCWTLNYILFKTFAPIIFVILLSGLVINYFWFKLFVI